MPAHLLREKTQAQGGDLSSSRSHSEGVLIRALATVLHCLLGTRLQHGARPLRLQASGPSVQRRAGQGGRRVPPVITLHATSVLE